jgi:uncharacterized protein DUF6760
MPGLRASTRRGGAAIGGVISYPRDRVYREVAILGSYANWTLTEVLGLDHAERRRWVHEIVNLTEEAERQERSPW